MYLISLAFIKLFLLASLGFFLYKRSIVADETLRFLTFFIISLTIPSLIFSHIIANSGVVLLNSLWIFISLSVIIFFAGYILSSVLSLKQSRDFRKEFISLVSFQNSGYLPMNIAFFLFASKVRAEFLTYIFLYLLGFNFILWSIGSFFIFKHPGDKFEVKSLFTPPIVATVIALFLVYTDTAKFIPQMIADPVRMVGDLSFVLSMLVLGCWLAKIRIRGISKMMVFLGEACLLKLLILPFIFLAAVVYFKIPPLLGVFIVLQASMPSAASLPIVANLRGADSEFVSGGVFFSHVISMITIPLWLGLYLKVTGFSF